MGCVAGGILKYIAVIVTVINSMSKKSSIKPLLEDEVLVELRSGIEFNNQYVEKWGTRARSLTIGRVCRQCQNIDRVRVMNIRQAIKNQKFTGLCVSCSSKKHLPPQLIGHSSHAWKGGSFITAKGYIMTRVPQHPNACNGYVFEHRLVIEKSLGRYLLRHETVHHKNGVKSDNRIENLELWTKSHSDGQRYADMSIEEIKILIQMLEDILEDKKSYEHLV